MTAQQTLQLFNIELDTNELQRTVRRPIYERMMEIVYRRNQQIIDQLHEHLAPDKESFAEEIWDGSFDLLAQRLHQYDDTYLPSNRSVIVVGSVFMPRGKHEDTRAYAEQVNMFKKLNSTHSVPVPPLIVYHSGGWQEHDLLTRRHIGKLS